MKKILSLLFISLLIIVSKDTIGQGIGVTAAAGGSAYLGDLVQGTASLKQLYPALSLGINYDISEKFRARLNFSTLGAKGDDKLNKSDTYRARNLNFKTNIWEVALLGEYDFLKASEYDIVPYVFLGPGIYHFDPTTIDRHGVKVKLHDIGTEGQYLGLPAYSGRQYDLTQLNMQLGIGARYKISPIVTLGFELSFRKLFTDYLDDVSSSYPSLTEFANAGQQEASELSYRGDEVGRENPDIKTFNRGNPAKKDSYYTFQLRGSFRLKKDSHFNH